MKNEIIEQMRAELHKTYYCQGDFKHDLESLNGHLGPFFWMVRENGTELMKVDIRTIVDNFSSQAFRMSMFRDPNCQLLDFKYYCGHSMTKIFYYDGYKLVMVPSYEELKDIWYAIAGSYYWEMRKVYQEEYEMCSKPLEVKCSSIEVKKKLDKALEFAATMGDKSLKACIARFSRYERSAIDEYIQIGYDSGEYDFSFAQIRNGKCVFNGGIVFHDNNSEKRWQIHS